MIGDQDLALCRHKKCGKFWIRSRQPVEAIHMDKNSMNEVVTLSEAKGLSPHSSRGILRFAQNDKSTMVLACLDNVLFPRTYDRPLRI